MCTPLLSTFLALSLTVSLLLLVCLVMNIYYFNLQPRNQQVDEEVVHELELGGIAVMQI